MTPEQAEFYERGYLAGYEAGMTKARRKWTKTDVNRLKEWTGTNADLAMELNRSVMAVKMKRHKLIKAGEM